MKKLIALLITPSLLYARMPQVARMDKESRLAQIQKPRKITSKKDDSSITRRFSFLKKSKTFSEMDFEELTEAKNIQKEKRNFEIVIKYLERLLILCDDIDQKANLLVEVADIMFDLGHFEDAEKKYSEFINLYPGNSNIEYVSYRAIVCLSKGILSADRDQTNTEKTIEASNEFLKRAPIFTTYAQEVAKIRQDACKVIVANQFNISETCMNLGNFEGAKKRLELVRSNWLPEFPEVETTLAFLEVQLGQQFDAFKPSESAIKIAELSEKVSPKKNDMVARF